MKRESNKHWFSPRLRSALFSLILLSTGLISLLSLHAVNASSTIFTDTFTGTNGNSLSGSWVERLGNAQIQNNRAVGKTVVPEGFAVISNSEFTTNTTGWGAFGGGTITRRDFSSSPNIAPTGGTDNFGLEVLTGNGRAAWYAKPGYYSKITSGYLYQTSVRAYAPSSNSAINAARLLTTCGGSTSVSSEDSWQTLTLSNVRCPTDGIEIWLQNGGSGADVAYFDSASLRSQQVIITHDHGSSDVDISAKMTTPSSGIIAGAIVSRWGSDGNYWLLRTTYGKTSDNFQLVKVENYVESIKQQITYNWSANTQYTIRFVNAGSTYTAYINDVEQFTFVDAPEFNKDETDFGLLFTDVNGISWDDWNAVTVSETTSTATLAYTANTKEDAPALPTDGTLKFVSPTGTAGGDGSRDNPWDIATGVSNIDAGEYLVFLDGLYTVPAGSAFTFKGAGESITYIADEGSRPIISNSDGYAPQLNFGNMVVVKYLWFGGATVPPYTQQMVVAQGTGAIWQNNTFFNYNPGGVFVEGTYTGNIYKNNRFINTGDTTGHQHPFYMSNTSGTGSLIQGNIIVGGAGYLQIQGAKGYTVRKNFIGDNLYGLWLQNSSNLTVDHNIIWSTTSNRDGLGGVTSSIYNYNIFGRWTGADVSVSIGDHNVFVDGAPTPFGTNQTLWDLGAVPTYLNVSGARLDAAIEMVSRSFDQTLSQIHNDSSINHYFSTIRTALDSWPHLTAASLAQTSSEGTTAINSGEGTDDTNITLKFLMSSSDATATLTPEVEVREIGTEFSDVSTHIGSEVSYNGTQVTGSVTLSGLPLGKRYHWQARVVDSLGNGLWTSFGGNSETETDFYTDTSNPTAPSLYSPTGYVKDNTRPTLVFKKATDAGSGVSSYSVNLDSGKNKSYSASGIPASGNGSSSYIWKDDNDVKIEFKNENDSDATNDEIHVYFKGLNDNELTEGKHSWSVTATDQISNSTSQSADFYLDRTSPSISELAIADVSTVHSGVSYNLNITNRMPSFSGLATDPYQGSTVTNSNGTKDTFDKVSSGPQTLTLTLKKLKDGQSSTSQDAEYSDHLLKEYSLSDIQDTAGDKKSGRFYITTPFPLVDGYYKVSLSLKDNAGNTYDQPVFYLALNNQQSNLLANPVGTLKDITTGKLETIITKQETTPADTQPEGEKQETVKEEQGYRVKVKVVDTENKPVGGAKVTIHSKVQETTSDENGIATFTNVEPGDHRIIIAYSGFEGEQKVTLTGDVKEFSFDITVRQQNPLLTPQVIAIVGGLSVVVIVLIFLLLRSRSKRV